MTPRPRDLAQRSSCDIFTTYWETVSWKGREIFVGIFSCTIFSAVVMIPWKEIDALIWTLTSINILLTAGRFAIHYRATRRLRWDDHLNLLALLFLLSFMITTDILTPVEYEVELYAAGLNDQTPKISIQKMTWYMKINLANALIFCLVLYTVKASFLAFYWQIFEISSGFRKAWWGVTVVTALSFGASFLAVFWRCGSAENSVDIDACHGRSTSVPIRILTLLCVLNVFSDILLVVLPLAMLRSMLLQPVEKVGLAAMFGLVSIGIAFDILRTIYTASEGLSEYTDRNALWTTLEPIVAVMVCALPCYRRLLWPSRQSNQSSIKSMQVQLSSRSFREREDSNTHTSVLEGAGKSRMAKYDIRQVGSVFAGHECHAV